MSTPVVVTAQTRTVLPPVRLLRAARRQQQRVIDTVEQIPAAWPVREVLRGVYGDAVCAHYDELIAPRTRDLARRGYTQLRRLRAAEAAALGVPITAVSAWLTDTDDEHLIRGYD